MLPINPKIFKAYDIRGIYGQDFNDDLAYRLGLAFVELRKQDPDYIAGSKLRLAVASDMRLSSPALKESLIKGLLAAGVEVIDLGLVATPSFYFAVGYHNYDGGIMVSASHNPKEWNGFKLVRAKGVPVSGETGIMLLKEKILANEFTLATTPGTLTSQPDTLTEELDYTWKLVDKASLKKFKLVADTANSMGSVYLKKLLTDLGGEFIIINEDLDGTFPSHEADPLKEENLKQLQQAVISHQADLGIATDGDGDRVFFVDNLGQPINQAIVRGLLAKSFLQDQPGAKIGYDVRPGKITADLITAHGGLPIVTRVGHSLIKEQMIEENIFFAGESSGHFYFNSPLGCFEFPALMILKLLSVFSTNDQPIAEQVKPYQKYFLSGEINRSVDDIQKVFTDIKEAYADGEITKLDGLSVAYPDFWFNVRASNTEPKMRLNLEAISPEKMEEERDRVLKLMN
ncbi:MAG: phosphomannomutase/phosphoglucomutase [Patescibacteria group bacterium]|jgi:phosphomannomutase